MAQSLIHFHLSPMMHNLLLIPFGVAQRNWLLSTQPPPPQGARGRPSDFGLAEARRLSLSNEDRLDGAPVADAIIIQH